MPDLPGKVAGITFAGNTILIETFRDVQFQNTKIFWSVETSGRESFSVRFMLFL